MEPSGALEAHEVGLAGGALCTRLQRTGGSTETSEEFLDNGRSKPLGALMARARLPGSDELRVAP